LLDDVHRAVYTPWFHGDMQQGEAQRLLKNKKVGKFLVWMDNTKQGCFILSRVAPSKNPPRPGLVVFNKTIECIVPSNPEASPTYKIGKRSYTSLFQAVDTEIARRNLSPRKCEKFVNLRESFVALDIEDDLDDDDEKEKKTTTA